MDVNEVNDYSWPFQYMCLGKEASDRSDIETGEETEEV